MITKPKITVEQETRFIRIFQIFGLVKETDMLPHLSDSEIIKVLLWCDIKGFLHCSYKDVQKDGKTVRSMVFAACAYFIPKFEEKNCHIIPLKSEGDILYIAWLINKGDKDLPRRMLTDFLKKHPDTRQIILYKGDAKIPTIFKRKKGEKSG